MKNYEAIELDIDWEDRPHTISQMIPKAPAVPAEVRRSGSGAPPSAGPDPDEHVLDEQWGGADEPDPEEVAHRAKTGTLDGLGNPPQAS